MKQNKNRSISENISEKIDIIYILWYNIHNIKLSFYLYNRNSYERVDTNVLIVSV
jgi:hypothetical protein